MNPGSSSTSTKASFQSKSRGGKPPLLIGPQRSTAIRINSLPWSIMAWRHQSHPIERTRLPEGADADCQPWPALGSWPPALPIRTEAHCDRRHLGTSVPSLSAEDAMVSGSNELFQTGPPDGPVRGERSGHSATVHQPATLRPCGCPETAGTKPHDNLHNGPALQTPIWRWENPRRSCSPNHSPGGSSQ